MNKDQFLQHFIELRNNLRDFPRIPRSIINERCTEISKNKISTFLRELRKEGKLKYQYVDGEYDLGWWGRDIVR